MADQRSARVDLATGAALFALSAAVIYGAWTMDRLEARQIHALSAPGLMPGMLGLALAVCSLLLIAKAVRGLRPARAGAETSARGDASEEANPSALFRVAAAAAICLFYALGLVGRMPFWLATFLFVTVFIAFFEWEPGATPGRRAGRLGWAFFLGLATAGIVSYSFRELFLVRLP
jgi:hypothetical protein